MLLNRMLIIYAVVLTAAFATLLHVSAGGSFFSANAESGQVESQETAKFTEIDVERINIREPDGTLRMALYNKARRPWLVVRNQPQPHPSRVQAGMPFYNDEGTELGGLIFSGMETAEGVVSGVSLTFDRYEQDQIVQVLGVEQGDFVLSGVVVSDRSNESIDFEAVEAWRIAEPGPEKDALYEKTNLAAGAQRAFFGRASDKSSKVMLHDAQGRKRLALQVSEVGETEIVFYDETGEVVKRITAEE